MICRLNLERAQGRLRNQYFKERPIRIPKKELRRQRSEIITERSKAIKPIEQNIAQAEGDIELNEKKLDDLNTAILEASRDGDGKKIAEISRSIHHSQSVIDHCFYELETLYNKKEKMDQKFKKKMDQKMYPI